MAFIEPCFGIGRNLSLICQMTSEDIKHQLIIADDADSDVHITGAVRKAVPVVGFAGGASARRAAAQDVAAVVRT